MLVRSVSIPDAPDDGEGPYSHTNTNSNLHLAEPQETIFINRIQLRGLLGIPETSSEPGFRRRMVKMFRAYRP